MYDIIDRRGVRVATLELPHNQHIVGFGRVSVYVVEKDADDEEQFVWHPWP